MKKPVTLPVDVLQRWLDAEDAFIAAVAEKNASHFLDLKAQSTAFDALMSCLRDLQKARVAIQIIVKSEDRSRAYVEAVLQRTKTYFAEDADK